MILIEFRSSSASPNVFLAPLRSYIKQSYGEDDAMHLDDLRDLENLRAEASAFDVHEAKLASLIHYYTQLKYVAVKFPINERGVRVCFTWRDALGSSSETERDSNSSFDIDFELASVLFNIAAMFCQLGIASQVKDNAESLKRSCAFFQNAAGCFTQISELYPSVAKTSSDFSANTLKGLSYLMLAQAQECFWLKAISDKMKNGTVSKLAAAVSMLYEQSRSAGEGAFPVAWIAEIEVKSYQFQAACAFRKSLEMNESGKYGEEIAWLHLGTVKIKKALEAKSVKHAPSSAITDLQNLSTLFKDATLKAEKDNDVIYMEIIPKAESLPQVVSAQMVTAKFTPEVFAPPVSRIFFVALVPAVTYTIASKYSQRKDSLVASHLQRADEAVALCQAALVSLNLPSSLEAIEEDGVPMNIAKYSNEVRDRGGAKELEQIWQHFIVACSDRISTMLEDSFQLLVGEERDDSDMRSTFRERWTRPPSHVLSNGLKETCNSFRAKLDSARASDLIIKRKLEASVSGITLLSLPIAELQSKIPPLSLMDAPTERITALKEKLKSLQNFIIEVGKLMHSIKSLAREDDIGPLLLEAAAKNIPIKEDDVYVRNIKKYDDHFAKLDATIGMMNENLEGIKEANLKFLEWRKSNGATSARGDFIAQLAQSYKLWKELDVNLTEGSTFYSNFERLVAKNYTACQDFVSRRREETKSLIKNLYR